MEGNDDAVGMGFILGPIAGLIVEIEMSVLGSAAWSRLYWVFSWV